MEGTPGWIKPASPQPPLVREPGVAALVRWAGPDGHHPESLTQALMKWTHCMRASCRLFYTYSLAFLNSFVDVAQRFWATQKLRFAKNRNKQKLSGALTKNPLSLARD